MVFDGLFVFVFFDDFVARSCFLSIVVGFKVLGEYTGIPRLLGAGDE